MKKISSEQLAHFYLHYPTVVAVVTTQWQGKENAMSAAWHSPLSAAPRLYGVSISPKRFTHEMIKSSGEFALNFLPYSAVETISRMGSVSGRDGDKLAVFGIATQKGLKVQAPILEEAYAAYECRVVASHTYGDHEWFVGEG